jgi:transcriptional regulator with XRE-family HTH domain
MQAISNNLITRGYDPHMPAGRPATKQQTEFGKLLSSARKEVGLTQLELAQRIGVTQRVVAYWERESIGLKAEQLVSLADALGIAVDSLLGRNSKSERRGGPIGRAKRVFDQVTSLPRVKQQRVLDILETVLAGEGARQQGSKAS